jgi:hypothetical protein
MERLGGRKLLASVLEWFPWDHDTFIFFMYLGRG